MIVIKIDKKEICGNVSAESPAIIFGTENREIFGDILLRSYYNPETVSSHNITILLCEIFSQHLKKVFSQVKMKNFEPKYS